MKNKFVKLVHLVGFITKKFLGDVYYYHYFTLLFSINVILYYNYYFVG